MDIVISKSSRKDKKLKAVIDNKKTIHFGASGYSDYTKHKDDNKKEIRLLSESTENIPPIVLHEEELEELGYSVNGVAIKVIKNK